MIAKDYSKLLKFQKEWTDPTTATEGLSCAARKGAMRKGCLGQPWRRRLLHLFCIAHSGTASPEPSQQHACFLLLWKPDCHCLFNQWLFCCNYWQNFKPALSLGRLLWYQHLQDLLETSPRLHSENGHDMQSLSYRCHPQQDLIWRPKTSRSVTLL